MIKVLLSGGLGNQMFQYAAAKALAVRIETSFAVDLYNFYRKTVGTPRNYELDIFDMEVKQTSSIKDKLLVKLHPYLFDNKRLCKLFNVCVDGWAIRFDPTFELLKSKNTTLIGHFQNQQYFENIADELRSDFRFRKSLSGKNLDIAKQVGSSVSVSLHVRRGDYVTNKYAASNFITCGVTYYQAAINYISGVVDMPHFYIFSEDMDWVYDNLDLTGLAFTCVDWNRDEYSYIDMQLMSLCKHNIIANSSFSWWAAWLNGNESKKVIAPQTWFASEAKNRLLDEFYPAGWVKLK